MITVDRDLYLQAMLLGVFIYITDSVRIGLTLNHINLDLMHMQLEPHEVHEYAYINAQLTEHYLFFRVTSRPDFRRL